MKRFIFKDINDGYSFEVSDGEGHLGIVPKEIKDALEEAEAKIEELKELNKEVDGFLCHIENFLHGKDGEDVTELRAKLNKQ